MMTARDILSPNTSAQGAAKPEVTVNAAMPVFDVLPRLLEAPGHRVGVTEGSEFIGVVDSESLLGGLGSLFPARDDCSVVEVECAAADYSAALMTHAAEDADVHVVGLWSVPTDHGKVRVTLRVRCEDPAHVVRNLERYGFEVTATQGNADTMLELAARRFEELRLYLNI